MLCSACHCEEGDSPTKQSPGLRGYCIVAKNAPRNDTNKLYSIFIIRHKDTILYLHNLWLTCTLGTARHRSCRERRRQAGARRQGRCAPNAVRCKCRAFVVSSFLMPSYFSCIHRLARSPEAAGIRYRKITFSRSKAAGCQPGKSTLMLTKRAPSRSCSARCCLSRGA